MQESSVWPAIAAIPITVSIITTNSGSKLCSLPDLDHTLAVQSYEWGGYSWAAASNSIKQAVMQAVKTSLNSTVYLDHINMGFAESLLAPHSLKLLCFASFQTLLHTGLLPQMVQQALAACKPVLINRVHEACQHAFAMPPAADAFKQLDVCLRGCILQSIQARLAWLAEDGRIPKDFRLEEDAATAGHRAAVADKMQKLRHAGRAIHAIAGSEPLELDITSDKEEYDAIVHKLELTYGEAPQGFCFKWPEDPPESRAEKEDNTATEKGRGHKGKKKGAKKGSNHKRKHTTSFMQDMEDSSG